MVTPRLSVVIPTLDAAASLPPLLEDLKQANGDFEILVIDGGSRDRSVELAAEAGCITLSTEASRGQQLAAGAAIASAPWLLFLHADSRLPAQWLEAVSGFMEQPAAEEQAGYFRLALSSPQSAARRVEALANWRAQRLGLPYGDQGLLVSKRLYKAVGGYPAWPLMEDVHLVRRIGRGRLRSLPLPIRTSAARYEREGWWRRPLRNLTCLTLFFLGVPPQRLARHYNRGRDCGQT